MNLKRNAESYLNSDSGNLCAYISAVPFALQSISVICPILSTFTSGHINQWFQSITNTLRYSKTW